MSDPKTGANLTLSGWVMDCDRAAFRVTCADCGHPLPGHHDAEHDAIPEHVDRCCDCTDRILGAD